MDAHEAIRNFVTAYNMPGSDVFPLYGETVDWIEMPSGRKGGRDDLFAALRQAREMFTDLHLEILSITAGTTDGVLEAQLTLETRDGKPLSIRTIWIFGFDDGKIVKEHDYALMTKN